MENPTQDFRDKLAHFFTLQVANRILMGLGNLMAPFSKLSNRPVLPRNDFDWVSLLEDNWEAIWKIR